MRHSVKILLDSISGERHRLTTFELVFPRIVLAEFNTHRLFSRNSASSRAIPVEKMIKMVETDPYIPTHWGKNQKGMQADQEVDASIAAQAEDSWIESAKIAVKQAKKLLDLGIHKQITNRLLEPFMWHTVICTATEYDNFIHLRANKDAHPEIQKTASEMNRLLSKSTPSILLNGQWHLPLVFTSEKGGDHKILFHEDREFAQSVDKNFGERAENVLIKISAARCARVSYMTHDGKRDPQEDLNMYEKLRNSGHMSPLEHPARVMTDFEYHKKYTQNGSHLVRRETHFCGNFQGWIQLRKEIPNEWDILERRF